MTNPVFSAMVLEWGGEQFTIPPAKMFGAIVAVEQHLTMIELNKMLKGGSFQVTRLAVAWSALLNYAGAKSTPESVYLGMFEASETGAQGKIISAIQALLLMMVPQQPTPTTDPVGEQ